MQLRRPQFLGGAFFITFAVPVFQIVQTRILSVIAWYYIGYFGLIGTGFMLAEISLLQYFGVFLGHPIYAMRVCLFSLILSAGVGSLASDRLALNTAPRITVWAALVSGYLFGAQAALPGIFAARCHRVD